MGAGSERERSRWSRDWRFLTSASGVDDELAFHLEMRTRDLIASGLPPAAAVLEARRRFGDQKRVRESLKRIERQRGRRVRSIMWLDELRQDIRYGIRGLLKRPGFSLAAAVSLAIGLATVTIVYSLVDAYLLRPLPVPHAGEIVVLGVRTPGPHGLVTDAVPYPNFYALRNRRDLFAGASLYSFPSVTLRLSPEEPGEIGLVTAATGDFFPMLGVRPALGRFFDEQDDVRHEAVIVLTDALWHRRFNADPAVLGRPVRLNGKQFVVIGVTPPGFTGAMSVVQPDGFVPRFALRALEPGGANRDPRTDFTEAGEFVGRMAPGMTINRLRSGLELAARDLERQHPAENQGLQFVAYEETKARPVISVAGSMPAVALIFFALATLVLLVACANVANLLLVRSTARRAEFGLRHALGASRMRLIRQLLTETVVLAGGGLALAWMLSVAAIRALSRIQLTPGLPLRVTVSPDWRILLFAALSALGAALLAGLFPAFVVTRGVLRNAVQDGARGTGGGNRHRNVLVTVQLAVSVVALVAAGLFTRSIRNASQVDLGFKPDGVLKASIVPSLAGYDDHRALALYDRLAERVTAIPGVTKAAWATIVPLQAFGNEAVDVYADSPELQSTRQDHVLILSNWVSADYFDVLGIPLRSGRPFSAADDSVAPRVAIVNATAAKQLWLGKDPVGRVFRTSRDGPPVQVVGVAADGRYIFVNEQSRPFVYLPTTQDAPANRILLIKTRGRDPDGLIPDLRATINSVDPEITPQAVMTMDRHVGESVTFLFIRFAALLAGAIGALTLIQATLGLYGVLAYSVAQRSREIGIRMALGAEPGWVLGLVVGQGGRLVGLGLVVGLGVAIGASRVLQRFLVGIGTLDLTTFGAAIALLAGVGFGAVYMPARRAARLDPIKALREER
ncbi:MAG: ABC transporter permease [Gemmatimonadota bacterium]